MTDDSHHPNSVKDRSEDHQQAVEAAEHALDALRTGDLSRARSLLDEAQTAVERATHETTDTD